MNYLLKWNFVLRVDVYKKGKTNAHTQTFEKNKIHFF